MVIKLSGGKVYDPANKVSGEVRDIYVEDGKIVGAPADGRVAETYDVKGRMVMAGAIDPHTHIGGGKMTIARMMIPEDHMKDEVKRTALTRAGTGHAVPSTMVTGYRYAEMGYTACFEPAMLPVNAAFASVVGLPSASNAQPSGIGLPSFAATMILPRATSVRDKSIMRGDLPCRGNTAATGLVPNRGFLPPHALIAAGEVVKPIPIRPACASGARW